MFVHVFSFRWNPDAASAERTRAAAAIRQFGSTIEGLTKVLVGENVSPNSPDFGTTGVMLFESEEHFHRYNTHPAHRELLGWLLPLITPIELDFVAVS